MGLTSKPTFTALPFEIGKTYPTKFQTGERFTVKEIKYDARHNNIVEIKGIYEFSPQLGLCPLSPERLIPERVPSGEIMVCEHCGKH